MMAYIVSEGYGLHLPLIGFLLCFLYKYPQTFKFAICVHDNYVTHTSGLMRGLMKTDRNDWRPTNYERGCYKNISEQLKSRVGLSTDPLCQKAQTNSNRILNLCTENASSVFMHCSLCI